MPLFYLTQEEADVARACINKTKIAPSPELDHARSALRKLDFPESFVSDVTVSAQQLQTATLKLMAMNGPMSPGNLEGATNGTVRLHHNGGIFAINNLGVGREVEEEEL